MLHYWNCSHSWTISRRPFPAAMHKELVPSTISAFWSAEITSCLPHLCLLQPNNQRLHFSPTSNWKHLKARCVGGSKNAKPWSHGHHCLPQPFKHCCRTMSKWPFFTAMCKDCHPTADPPGDSVSSWTVTIAEGWSRPGYSPVSKLSKVS